MALVLGHAVRRREGIAANPLVMAETGNVAGESSPTPCTVRGCQVKWSPSMTGEALQKSQDLHMMVDHPRHHATAEARTRYRSTRPRY